FAGNVQVTDNIQFVPYNSPDGAQKPRAGVVGELNPAVILSYETPRWLHELQYTLNLATVFGVGDQFNYTNRLELRSRYDVSELTQVNFAIRATQGGVTFFPEPEAGKPVAAFAPGVFTFGTLELAQGVNHRLGEFVVFTEQAQVQVFRPIQADPPRPGVYGGNMQLAIAYNDDPDNYAANLGVQLAATEEIECVNDQQCGAGRVCAVATRRCEIASTTAPALADEIRAQANAPMIANRLGVNYRHDFRNGFNGEVDLGVQQAMRLTDGGGQNWQPVGRLGLRFQEEDINFAITANHGAQLNPNAGGLVMATNVDLVGGVALDRQTRNWVVQLQTGYQRGTPFDTFGALLPGFHVAAADAALTYRPERWLPNFTAALRYQFRVQITEAQPGLAVLEDLIAMRHAVAINVGFEFPEKKPAP
ncbi:MAG: hypothetical protein R3B70_20100, partial [Polyangiaceae bacterium]